MINNNEKTVVLDIDAMSTWELVRLHRLLQKERNFLQADRVKKVLNDRKKVDRSVVPIVKK